MKSMSSIFDVEQRAKEQSKKDNCMVIFSKRYGIYIEINFYNQVILIGGDSGDGKTYFIETLKAMAKNCKKFDIINIDISRFYILPEPTTLSMYIGKADTLLIDRGDIMTKENVATLNKHIVNEKLVILFARSAVGVQTEVPVYGDTFEVQQVGDIDCFLINSD